MDVFDLANKSVAPKRRRGAQPGNSNAKGNRGNRFAQGKPGNRGGGAPLGNLNALRKGQAFHESLLQEYKHIPEAVEWINLHLDEVNSCIDDSGRDRALYFSYLGLTPESLIDRGLEYQLGVYTAFDEDFLGLSDLVNE